MAAAICSFWWALCCIVLSTHGLHLPHRSLALRTSRARVWSSPADVEAERGQGKPAVSASPAAVPPRIPAPGSGPRVYTPRSERAPGSGPVATGSAVSSANRVYNVRSGPPGGGGGGGGGSYSPRPSSGGGGGGGGSLAPRSTNERVVFLNAPQLLIRYRLPREKTPFKLQLEESQEQLQEQADAAQAARGGSWGGGGGYGGGGGGGGGKFGGARDAFFDNFDFPPSGDGKRGGAGARAKGGGKDVERKGSEGGRPKSSSTGRRGRNEGEDSDDTLYDDEEGEGGAGMDLEADYYGDEASVSLGTVPSSALRTMENEGFSLEEIQMSLYGEYGIKASISSIKRRLQDDQMSRRKKTGKTKRDRTKARNERWNPKVQQGVELPDGPIQVGELARLMEVGGGEVVKHLMMNMGIMSSMTQNVDKETAKSIVLAFGKTLAGAEDDWDAEGEGEDEDGDGEEEIGDEVTYDGVVYKRNPRPPIVTIMGHVDHGKTSLLDSIRNTQIALGEAGGITQGMSAFKVQTSQNREVTFIDTPGHAAFSEMRRRGANVTDIIILVVAADDGIMEQTKECIVAAKTAGCPVVVAINKIDKEGADPQRIITDLMSYDLLVEDFGGDVQCAQVSAKKGMGVEELLDKVLLQADVMNLKAADDCKATGTVIEARVDKGLGVVASCLVQEGTLRVGDIVLAGPSWGKVRRITSDQGIELKEAGPSTPVQIVGLTVVPNAGDSFSVTVDEEAAREVAEARQRITRQAAGVASSSAIIAQAAGFVEGTGDRKEIIKVPIVIKGDVAGSIEALRAAIDALQVSDDDSTCKADIVYAGVGDVTSSDVAIAAVSKAKIVAFNVAAASNAMNEARASNVDIGYYNVVYDLLDELESQIKTTLAPPPPGTLVGRAEIKKIFKLGKVGKVAGCTVTEGMLKANSKIRIMRGKRNPVYTGTFTSLKVVKEAVQEVPSGSECGTSFDDFQDFEEGDVIECYE